MCLRNYNPEVINKYKNSTPKSVNLNFSNKINPAILYLYTLTFITLISCNMQKKSELTNNEKMEVPATNKTSKGIDIISGEIVEKALTNSLDIDKNQKEFYIRCSVQDYFIKFCESDISKEQLLKYFDPNKLINPITVKGKIVHGLLDTCPNKAYTKSRIGYYVVIYSIEDQ